MPRPKKRKQEQASKITDALKRIEKVASTAVKIYRTVDPIVRAIIRIGGELNDEMVFSAIEA